MSLAGFRELIRVANLALEHMEDPPHPRAALCRKCFAADAIYKALHDVIFRAEPEYPMHALKNRKKRPPKGN